MNCTRRSLIKTALALPATAWLEHYHALAAPARKMVKITAIKAMQVLRGGNCLVKVETDAGLTGYGEAGATGPMARARIETIKQFLIGQDPLAVDRHFEILTTQMHANMAHIPTISGIDIALWDLAGKITGLPVSTLMGGPFRNKIRLYINSLPKDMLDPASCREWAQRVKADPNGWTTFKMPFMPLLDNKVSGQIAPMLSRRELMRVQRGFENVREALGPDYDIAVHCHNEFDLPSATGIGRAVEGCQPMWFEDPMPVQWSESWPTLKRSLRVPILTGEKLEMPRQFFPFLQNQAVDMIQPDLAFSGGLTGCRKIADLAALYNIPLNTHNVGTLPLTMASVHFGAAIRNYTTSENALTPGNIVLEMGTERPVVKNSYIDVPTGPGLGFELNQDVLRANLKPGEPWWG
jgi:galactonate dehydratase